MSEMGQRPNIYISYYKSQYHRFKRKCEQCLVFALGQLMGQLCILSSAYLIESMAGEALKKPPPGLIPKDSQSIDLKWGPDSPVLSKAPQLMLMCL